MEQSRLNWSYIDLETITRYWPAIADGLAPAVEYSFYDLPAVRDFLVSGNAQLWAIADIEENKFIGYVVTEIVQFPKTRVLSILLAAGERIGEWFRYFEILEDFAKAHDCTHIQVFGRPGLEKVLKPLGFHSHKVMLNKNIASIN
jgi:hypothetical protein